MVEANPKLDTENDSGVLVMTKNVRFCAPCKKLGNHNESQLLIFLNINLPFQHSSLLKTCVCSVIAILSNIQV